MHIKTVARAKRFHIVALGRDFQLSALHKEKFKCVFLAARRQPQRRAGSDHLAHDFDIAALGKQRQPAHAAAGVLLRMMGKKPLQPVSPLKKRITPRPDDVPGAALLLHLMARPQPYGRTLITFSGSTATQRPSIQYQR